MLTALPRAAAFAAIVVASAPAATAQSTSTDPHHPDATVAQATPPSGMVGQTPGAQPGQPGMMGQGMMGQSMMGQGTMGMPGHMMKIIFAIADVDGDGALSLEEVTAIHTRIFKKIDANKDGKVTPEEAQAFMRE